jgi:glutaredoxin
MHLRTDLVAGELTVYGTRWCGWTKKQRAFLDQKGIVYAFVDCEKEPCPEFVRGFPTLLKDGQILRGFQEL